jgi:2-polyprenyl-3-methyl-5-hydroxy-6-metoxy-1,4-benzoquinol methylase
MTERPNAANEDDTTQQGSPSLEQQKDYWKFWQRTRSCSDWARQRADFLLQIVASLPLQRPAILDFGCGNGWFCNELSAFGDVTGIDLNEEAMREARDKWPGITFIGGDVFDHEPAGMQFDLIVSQQVIAHVDDQPTYVSKIAQLLRPGGYLLLTTNNKFVMQRLGTSDWGSERSSGHLENWLSMVELRGLVSKHLEILETNTLLPMGDGGILRLVNSSKINRVLGFCVGTERLARLKEYAGLGYYLIVLARKPNQ